MNARLQAAAMLLVLLPGLALPAAATTGPFVVMISLDLDDHSPGETVNFSVHTFSHGGPATPDGPPSVTLASGALYGRPLPVKAEGPGAWSGSYKVLAADADEYGSISLRASARFSLSGGGEQEYTNYGQFRLAGSRGQPAAGGVSIRAFVLECPDGAVKARSSVTFSVNATRDGAPVLPGDIRFWVVYDPDYGTEEREDVQAAGSGPGTYLVRHSIPARTVSGSFRLGATCNGTDYGYLATVQLDFCNVIYHELSRNGSAIDYELLVSDRAGNPVNGSEVRVALSSYSFNVDPIALELGRTDRNGKVRGVVDLGPGVGWFNLRGWANTSKYSQSFYGTVRVSDAPGSYGYYGDRFQIERLSTAGGTGPGNMTITYRAMFQGEPVSRQALDCYVQLFLGAYRQGTPAGISGQRPVTGTDGTFSLNTTVPEAASSWAYVTCVGPGPPYSTEYSQASDVVTLAPPPDGLPAPWANASFGAASPGRAVRITASAPAGALAAASASWDFPYNSSAQARPWMVLNTFTWYFPSRHAGRSAVQGDLVLPRHLKAGQNLTVEVSFVNASGQRTSAGFPLKVRSAAAAPAPDETCCLTTIFVFNALLIALLFYNYRAARRGDRARELGELGADDQIEAVLRGAQRPRRDLSLPIKVELVRTEDCTGCGRRIAQGNLAWRCVCGARYHEHCAGDGTKCPSCGRGWKKD